jgi:hypothetical protein
MEVARSSEMSTSIDRAIRSHEPKDHNLISGRTKYHDVLSTRTAVEQQHTDVAFLRSVDSASWQYCRESLKSHISTKHSAITNQLRLPAEIQN